MEPVEINAGTYYLRALRADDRIDDRPALLRAFADPEFQRWMALRVNTPDEAAEYVRRRAAEWVDESRCSWAVAEPTTGELLAEVGLTRLELSHETAEVYCWAHPDHRGKGVVTTAVRSVLRFGFGGLGLHRIAYWHTEGNDASNAVAVGCGFTYETRLREAAIGGGRRRDLLVYSLLATDPGWRSG